MQSFKIRNDNNMTSKPDEIQYRPSDGVHTILTVCIPVTYTKIYKVA
jgi:hypothetical protein